MPSRPAPALSSPAWNPAARAGIAVGDDLIRIDSTPIASLDQANAYLSQHGNAHLILGLRHQDAVRMVALDRSPD